MAETPLLTCTALTKWREDRLVFKNISLTLAPGDVLLLTGSNGSGKSTLLKLLAGLIRPTSGTIHSFLAPHEIGYLGHASHLYPSLTAWENLQFWGAFHAFSRHERTKRIGSVLEAMDLTERRDDRVETFSCGMKQRLALARVFLGQPRLLLLDEPAAGLDTPSTSLFHALLGAHQEKGGAAVWVTHDPDHDRGMANRVVRIEYHTLIDVMP